MRDRAGWVANRMLVPYPIVMVLTGVALGFAYDWPTFDIDPNLVLATSPSIAKSALAREVMRRAAVDAINRLVAEHGIPAYEAVAVRRFFTSRTPLQSSALAPVAEARLWLSASTAQRDVLLVLWRNGEIGEDVLIQLEREIDLAELRLVSQ